MAENPEVSYDRVLRLAFIAGIGIFIFSFMHAVYLDAHSRGLQEAFQYVFYAAGFTVFVFVLKAILRRRE